MTITMDAASTTGNTLIFAWGTSSTSDCTGPSGGGVTTWVKDAESTARRSCSIWSGVVDTTPSAVITVSAMAGTNTAADVSEWSGLDSGGTLVQGFSIKNAQGTAASGANCSHTPTSSSDVVLIYVNGQQSNSATGPSAGWTALTAAGGIGPSAYQIVTAASGAYSNKFSIANNYVVWDAAIVAYNVASGGGGSYTLTADAGTYTTTGTAATLRADRKLSAASGTYTTTGTDATLRVARKITAASGTYTTTGTDATLRVGRKLVAASGTYTTTGTDATLRVARRLVADSGTYATTGTDATLTYSGAGGLTLIADSGTYTTTGTDATLRVRRRMTAASGTYTTTGTDATLRAARRLTAASGSYTTTGTAATLRCGRVVGASSGTYATTGTAASLRCGRRLVADSGTYLLVGTDATLTYSAAVAVSSALTVTRESGVRYLITRESGPRYRITREG